MNKKDFFTWAGYMAERLDFPCDTCPVRKYKNENKDYEAVILTEESYTSGTSFLDGEAPIKENYNKSRRIHRGLFKTSSGKLINADVNGAFQIMRKVFPNVSADGIEGVVLRPVVVVAA